MNILHMKYAVEVAKLGSLNKAAETLLIAQPNISRSIKELEADLGITIFTRSAKGMVLTPDGEEFINYAKSILKQIDDVENLYKQTSPKKQKFSISVPRACYISAALAEFSKGISGTAEILYKETNSKRTIDNVLSGDYKLGIIRYAKNYDKYFKSMLEEKGLSYEIIADFSYVLIMSRENPLAERENVTFDDLSPYIEIAHADPYVPSLSLSKVAKEEHPGNADRKIFVFERASQFDLLSENSETFMWVSPASQKLLDRYGLVQRKCLENTKKYKDVLIYRDGYKLTQLDKQFITSLCESKRKYLK
ncbi:MAG: LysR family transcriptional regulator [Clostridia bacterium]|nr:LysR family transcriptional regulator [Clostridia bacterium]